MIGDINSHSNIYHFRVPQFRTFYQVPPLRPFLFLCFYPKKTAFSEIFSKNHHFFISNSLACLGSLEEDVNCVSEFMWCNDRLKGDLLETQARAIEAQNKEDAHRAAGWYSESLHWAQ